MAFLAEYTPLQRFRIVLAGIVLLALAAYFLSIRNTFIILWLLTQHMLVIEE